MSQPTDAAVEDPGKDPEGMAAGGPPSTMWAGSSGAAEPVSGGRWARWKGRTTGGAPLYPLAVLFGLNAVDELDRTAFGVLLPEIRDHFGLGTGGILTVVSLALIAALILALPIGFYSDRGRRVPIAVGGAAAWGVCSIFTGLAATLWMLGIARAGSGLGRAVNDPVHNSLLADYYDVPVRPRVYGVHRYANATGQFVGAIGAGMLAFYLGWRAPFFVFAVVTAIFVILALRLREPVRGRFERRAMGASAAVSDTEEEAPSWAESWRILWQVRSLRRIFVALPFVAIAIVGFVLLGGLFYEEIFGLDERARGFVIAGIEGPAHLIGLLLGIPLATKLLAGGPGRVLRFLAYVATVVSVAWVLFALAPTLPLAIAANAVVSGGLFLLIPGIFAVLSLAIPAKVRSFGFAVGTLFILPGLLLLPVVGGLADVYGIRTGLIVAAPVFVIGGWIIASAGSFVAHDIERVWTTAAARSEVAHLRRQGQVKLLLARGIDVHYDGIQVLFGVDLEVDEGEIVALLGTNGAGKSTLLRAMSGLVQPSGGAVIFDGRDITNAPPNEIAARGITQVPGGQGVFTNLSVADNLRLAGWLQRRDTAQVREATARVLEIFPQLRERLHEPAGNLSGGQQQMLTLGMAFIGRPRLLMIDELSLGLAPVVVAQLLDMVRMLRDNGTTIILVEQSVNLALTVAERAFFMEKGEIRFEGATSELLDRPDLLRSVFLSVSLAGEARSPLTVPVAEGQGPTAASADASAADLDLGATRSLAAPERGDGGPGEELGVPSVETELGEQGATRSLPDPRSSAATRSLIDPEMVLEVRELTKRFGGIQALDRVSFDVRADEILGFIGPNGAGKTTLFDVISGFTPAERGTIHLRTEHGHHALHNASIHQRAWQGLGRSFQDGRLFPGLTVAETLAVALEQHVEVRDPLAASLHLPTVGDSERRLEQRVEELIELLGLGAYRDKFVRELSTGTRRIVDLGCVLAQGSRVVLLDEPSSGIAQREAEALGPVLARVRQELGASLLIIEHDLPLLLGLADRMIALDLGRIVAEGDPHDVVNHPEVVASYLGTDAAAIDRSGELAPG
jgi:ABC-type branched-subunit amino acid transport system ATPase component/MFS family permease